MITYYPAEFKIGVKKVSAPSKNPAKCPIICFAREKKLISGPFKISGTLIVNRGLMNKVKNITTPRTGKEDVDMTAYKVDVNSLW